MRCPITDHVQWQWSWQECTLSRELSYDKGGILEGTIEGALALGLYKTYPATKNSTVTHDSHFAWLTVMAL
jgi:hypothetical protein